uniref:Ig-like domain-containing protein n=1 Tax=Phlebotomus papatasi TaxID=29031 RepID=A0A1B0DQ84_PHLPP
MVSATCTVNKGDPPIDISWRSTNGQKVTTNDGILISRTSQRISTLSIESVRARHRGNYTCVAKNSGGMVEYSAELAVNVLPQIVPFDFGTEVINEMDMVSAYCSVNKGDLPVNIYWTKDGRKVFTNDGILISKTSQRISVLSIESVRDRHSGNYTCWAENNAGSVHHSAQLHVNG